jgi:REP element-mobilizing transposase RayT
MGRLPRAIDDGLVYHALNRGNNRARVFANDDDHLAFLQALATTNERYPFRLFGYCLMSNHFHLLLRPEPGQSISRILQSVTVAHTWRYNVSFRQVCKIDFSWGARLGRSAAGHLGCLVRHQTVPGRSARGNERKQQDSYRSAGPGI